MSAQAPRRALDELRHVSEGALSAPSPVDSRSLALLGRLVAKRAISAARLVSWMMLYSAGVVHRPRLKDVGRSSSALVALLLRSTWVGIAGLKGLVGTDRWLSQLAAITIFQIASWAVRKAVAARPGLVLARRGGLLPLLSAVGMPLLPGWADDAERVADLTVALERCRTYAEHRRVAVALDRATGMQAWRERDDALPLGLLNVSDLKDRITRYKRLERDGDAHGLMWSLRADLHRRPAGSGSPQLYGMALSGTKLVVEEHSKVTASALDFLCDECEPESVPARLSFFQEARHAFGRSALLLSGGATNGIYHLGVIRALRDVHLLPPIVSGASAGSIVAALLGCKTDEELDPILQDGEFDTRFFQVMDPRLHAAGRGDAAAPAADAAAGAASSIRSALGWLYSAASMYSETRAVFDASFLANTLRQELGDLTFGEAFRRTGRVINIPVAPQHDSDFPRLLNYLTAPHVVVWSASVASCAIPGVFQPVELLAKDDAGEIRPYASAGHRWTDGSIELDLPMQRLSELFNVNLFIVSQVNPHAMLLAVEGPHGRSTSISHVVRFLKRQSRSFLTSFAELGHALGLPSLAARGVLPFLTQPYEGDLTLMPPLGLEDFAKLLENPSQERVVAAILTGQRMTWPHIPWVRVNCLVEATLEACVRRLRRRLRDMAASASEGRGGLGHVPEAGVHHTGRGFGEAASSSDGSPRHVVPGLRAGGMPPWPGHGGHVPGRASIDSLVGLQAAASGPDHAFDMPEQERADDPRSPTPAAAAVPVARSASAPIAPAAPGSGATRTPLSPPPSVSPVAAAGRSAASPPSGPGSFRWMRRGSEARLSMLSELAEDGSSPFGAAGGMHGHARTSGGASASSLRAVGLARSPGHSRGDPRAASSASAHVRFVGSKVPVLEEDGEA